MRMCEKIALVASVIILLVVSSFGAEVWLKPAVKASKVEDDGPQSLALYCDECTLYVDQETDWLGNPGWQGAAAALEFFTGFHAVVKVKSITYNFYWEQDCPYALRAMVWGDGDGDLVPDWPAEYADYSLCGFPVLQDYEHQLTPPYPQFGRKERFWVGWQIVDWWYGNFCGWNYENGPPYYSWWWNTVEWYKCVEQPGNPIVGNWTMEVLVERPEYSMTISLDPGQVRPRKTAIPPQHPNQGMPDDTEVTLTVWDCSDNRVPNAWVEVHAEEIDSTGGHFHPTPDPPGQLARPVGYFTSDTTGLTDQSGEFRTTYVSSQFGGREAIVARAFVTAEDSAYCDDTLDVLLPELAELGGGQYYILEGGTELHPGPPGYPEWNLNHCGGPKALAELPAIAIEWHDVYHYTDILEYNDMSLPRGGGFDIFGDWDEDITPPDGAGHWTHRDGRNCDINPYFPDPNKNQDFINLVRDHQGTARPEPERNHYHVTFWRW